MFSKQNKRYRFNPILALTVLALASLACGLFGGGSVSPFGGGSSSPSAFSGDYGDAPDDKDAGYYAPSGGPFLFTYEGTGIQGSFPTLGDDPIPGPYTKDVDEFWIGPLFGGGGSAHVPSLENDADDPDDPDGVENLGLSAGAADCDQENGAHNPAGNNCASTPAYSMPMNARLSIMFGSPPLGIWITSVTASETMSYSGPVYWNLLFDLNQDGDWADANEWIAQDVLLNLEPGETETLISSAFRFPTSGSPFGRLNFPYWVRSMVTSESVADVLGTRNWDGRGPEDGFEVGEVEDYFVEWQPIGQKRKGPGGAGSAQAETQACAVLDSEELTRLPGSDMSDIIRLVPGVQVDRVDAYTVRGNTGGGTVDWWGELDLTQGSELNAHNNSGFFDLRLADGILELQAASNLPDGGRVILLPNILENGNCSGSAPVYVGPGFFSELPPAPTPSIYGTYLVNSTFLEGDKSHDPFAQGTLITQIDANEGIIFSGPDPFVTVRGDFDPITGEFSAAGQGVVAGYSDITVHFDGTITLEGGLVGAYEMGANQGLPGGKSITYEIIGQQILPTSTAGGTFPSGPPPLDQGVVDSITAFTTVFNQAFVDLDSEPLFELLHPAVLDMYGEESCRTYLEGIVTTPTMLEITGAEYHGVWTFERDGVSRDVEDAYRIFANFTANDQTQAQELHLVLPGDDSVRWFTDCGDPLVP